MEEEETQREYGVQPVDGVMTALGLSNGDLVAASTEQLTHKQVAKARKGRRISANLQGKIVRALNAGGGEAPARPYRREDLFNY